MVLTALHTANDAEELVLMKAPFPYFGSKRGAAAEIWRRFGNVSPYIEPFAGSLGCLLARPWRKGQRYVETVNDSDGHITNVWRSIKFAPEQVLEHCDWPVNELDKYARQVEMISARADLTALMRSDPDAFDARLAGRWIWGACVSIGSDWHAPKAPNSRPQIDPKGGAPSCGVCSMSFTPSILRDLSFRLRFVVALCGDWSRCVSPVMRGAYGGKTSGVLLDPPYSNDVRASGLYSDDDGSVAAKARVWAIEHGDNPRIRIALCGLAEEHDMPDAWDVYDHSGNGGESVKSGGERIWFSPHCIPPTKQGSLF
jgi:DNA adenine methylase